MKNFGGEVLFLDRSDINTDEIIPAKYLTELTKVALKPYLLEDLKLDGFTANDINGKSVIVTRDNFGCGSSREHAPWALEVNNINVVIASGYARIFRQNMFNCGMCAIELKEEDIETIFKKFSQKKSTMEIDFTTSELFFSTDGVSEKFSFELDPFNFELIKAGGWINYADQKY
jgi:3-isopropylmalate/(R)-2-methylmalate dehydratase small subunit